MRISLLSFAVLAIFMRTAQADNFDLCDNRVESEQWMSFKWIDDVLSHAYMAGLGCGVELGNFSTEVLRRVVVAGCSAESHVYRETAMKVAGFQKFIKDEKKALTRMSPQSTAYEAAIRLVVQKKGGCDAISARWRSFLRGEGWAKP